MTATNTQVVLPAAAASIGLLGTPEQQAEMYGVSALGWPGSPLGFPATGTTGPLRDQEFRRLAHVAKFSSQRFRLWDDEDKAAFDRVMQYVTMGLFAIRNRKDNWIEASQHYQVWLEWVQIMAVPVAKPIHSIE